MLLSDRHAWEYAAKGRLLESFNTGLLEKGKSYDGEKLGKFIAYFQPRTTHG